MGNEVEDIPYNNDSKLPLTVFAKHHVRPDALQDFEALIRKATAIQKERFEGYLSSELIRPLSGSDSNEYVSIFRYDSYAHLKRFMDSKERQDLLEEARAFADRPPEYSFHAMEHFFSIPPTTATVPPAKWKLFFVFSAVVFAQQQWVPKVVDRVVPNNVPAKVNQLLTVMIIVSTALFLILPVVTRLLAFWLFPHERYLDKLGELIPSFCLGQNSLSNTNVLEITEHSREGTKSDDAV